MRNPRNEAGELAPGPRERKADPVRSCILSREKGSPEHLVRLALGPDGRVWPDVRAKAPGRGAWIGVPRAALEAALAKGRLRGALARAFKTAEFVIPDDLPAQIESALERASLDRLGLEARAGALLTGSERIEAAARSGQLHALYHAADAGEDGRRKLAQAWRVGQGEEGGGRRGVALPVPRPILSMALGRENVVHIGLTDGAAARRVGDMLGRWLTFIGHSDTDGPCEMASQGATAAGDAGAHLADVHQAENARGT